MQHKAAQRTTHTPQRTEHNTTLHNPAHRTHTICTHTNKTICSTENRTENTRQRTEQRTTQTHLNREQRTTSTEQCTQLSYIQFRLLP